MRLQIANLKSLVLAGLLLAYGSCNLALYAWAGETELNLACSGNSYTADGPFPTPETFSLKIEGKKPVLIGGLGSEKPVKARTLANNAIQVKFATREFTGEYFNFTGDLFLIHKDGRLTKLLCKPS